MTLFPINPVLYVFTRRHQLQKSWSSSPPCLHRAEKKNKKTGLFRRIFCDASANNEAFETKNGLTFGASISNNELSEHTSQKKKKSGRPSVPFGNLRGSSHTGVAPRQHHPPLQLHAWRSRECKDRDSPLSTTVGVEPILQ